MLALSELNTSTTPPALMSMSTDVADTAAPAYTEVRAAAKRLIARALRDKSSATSTDADLLLDDTDAPEDRVTGPLEPTDALPIEAVIAPPANASIPSEVVTDIRDVVTAAEKASTPIAPPETCTVSAPTSIDPLAPIRIAGDAAVMLSAADSSSDPKLDTCTPEAPIPTDEPPLRS